MPCILPPVRLPDPSPILSVIFLLALLLLPHTASALDQSRSARPAVSSATEDAQMLLVVRDDPGGSVRERLKQIEGLQARHARVELRGRYCNSACTLMLGVGDVCVAPRTRFGFHGPHYLDRPIPQERFEYWSQRMAELYPPRVREWFMSTARYRGKEPLTLTGAQLIEMGVPSC